jgi:uncharacterized protein
MRYNSLSRHFRQRLGAKARKIPLDAGFSCPNRDGTIGHGGCLYCPPRGSGTGAHERGETLARQWREGLARLRAKDPDTVALAYLQAYSNTHGAIERLRRVLAEVAALPELGGLCLGTRPDCLDERKIDALAGLPLTEVRLELGLQSSDPATLARVNRGHAPEDFARAAKAAAGRGLFVVAHVMAGLPGEAPEQLSDTVDFVSRLPVDGIKFHNTYVAEGSGLAEFWRAGGYAPLARDDYVGAVAAALARLRPDIVVERLAADPAEGELLAPAWAADKRAIVEDIKRLLEERDIRQGMNYAA